MLAKFSLFFFFFCKWAEVSLWNKVRRMRPAGESFSSDVCACWYVHVGCMDRHHVKPIYVPDVPVFIREPRHRSVLLTASPCNWLTGWVSTSSIGPGRRHLTDMGNATLWPLGHEHSDTQTVNSDEENKYESYFLDRIPPTMPELQRQPPAALFQPI